MQISWRGGYKKKKTHTPILTNQKQNKKLKKRFKNISCMQISWRAREMANGRTKRKNRPAIQKKIFKIKQAKLK